MAITWFWRFENATLDGTDDHANGSADTTATTNGSASLDAAAARVGTLGGLFPASGAHQFRFDSSTDMVDRLVGAVGFSMRIDTAPSGLRGIAEIRGTNGNFAFFLVSGELRVYSNLELTGEEEITTSGASLAEDVWYGVIFRWDNANNLRRIEIYDANGDLVGTPAEESTAWTAPTDLATSAGLRIGNTSGGDGIVHMDNFFIADTYAEPIEDNFTITSFTAYSSGGGDPAPSITDVDSDESITSTQAGWEITGTDFDTATVEIRQGDVTVAQTVNSQDATTIDCDTVFDDGEAHLKYGSATLAVVNGDEQEDTISITIAAPTGRAYVDIATPNTTAENRITAVEDIASGDQIEVSNVIGGTISDVTVNDDATFDADEEVDSFDVRVWDSSDATWGNVATQTVGEPPADETPDAFSFTDVTGAQTSAVQTSNTITVSGLGDGVSVDVTVSGGTYSKNGGSYTSSAGTAINGDTFAVRHTSSSSYETTTDTTLTIGDGSDTFTSTTQAEPTPSEGGGLVLSILRRRRR